VKDGEPVVVAANFLIDAESNLKAAIGGFSSAPPAAPAKAEMPSATGPATPKGAGHQAEGTVDSVDAKAGTISLSHGPVPSLKWPAMTMEFKAANPPCCGAQAGCEGQLSSSSSDSPANGSSPASSRWGQHAR
jgi:Cu(I)/Ag(I) efflux system membrane fusion protein